MVSASCQCGKIKLEIGNSKPIKLFVCHCLECRRQSSSLFGTSAVIPAFDFPKEGLQVFTRLCDSGRTTDCYFCTSCGSRLMHISRGGKFITVKGGTIQDLPELDFWNKATHIYTRTALVPIPEGVDRYEAEPPLAVKNPPVSISTN